MIRAVPAPCQTVSNTSFVTNQIKHSGTKNIQVRLVTVQTCHSELCIVIKDRSLAATVRGNEALAVGSSIGEQNSPAKRIDSLGRAVTGVSNSGGDGKAKTLADEICKRFPTGSSVEIYSGPAIGDRGGAFLESLNDGPLTSTIYSAGLNYGLTIEEEKPDPTMRNHFAVLWGLSITTPQKNDAEKVIKGSVRKLREIFEPHKH